MLSHNSGCFLLIECSDWLSCRTDWLSCRTGTSGSFSLGFYPTFLGERAPKLSISSKVSLPILNEMCCPRHWTCFLEYVFRHLASFHKPCISLSSSERERQAAFQSGVQHFLEERAPEFSESSCVRQVSVAVLNEMCRHTASLTIALLWACLVE